MTETADTCLVFDSHELLPVAWRPLAAQGPVRTFNPGLLRDGNTWVLAYRVVAADGMRRIALCRLDERLRVIDGTQLAFSDIVTFHRPERWPAVATQWFADPRLYRLRGRVFVYWNSGWHEPANCQFVQELDATTLRPIGHARELVLRGERQKLEKNWTFFDAGDPDALFAVYSITPHRVLRFSLTGDDDIVFDEVAKVDWSIEGYPFCHGGLRGGAPPVLKDGEFWSFCHSVHDGPDGYRYAAAAYRFAAKSPFQPTWKPTWPLEIGKAFGSKRSYDRLNPAVADVIYPCGAAVDGTRWLISHGINDECCALSSLPSAAVASALQPVGERV
jgi:hypothetical protein